MSEQVSLAAFLRTVVRSARKKILYLPMHIVCSPKPEFLAIITAYTPAPNEWDSSFKVRKTGGKDE